VHGIAKRNAKRVQISTVNNKLFIILIRSPGLFLLEAEVADLSREGNTGCL
jgi:hypothetical protein